MDNATRMSRVAMFPILVTWFNYIQPQSGEEHLFKLHRRVLCTGRLELEIEKPSKTAATHCYTNINAMIYSVDTVYSV
jgi:hypothetical protein